MASYAVCNGTNAPITVNAANDVVAANDQIVGTTLTATELATVLATPGVAVMADTTTEAQKKGLARLVRFGKYEGTLGGKFGKARK